MEVEASRCSLGFWYLSRFMSVVACMCLCHGLCLAMYLLYVSMCGVFLRRWAACVLEHFFLQLIGVAPVDICWGPWHISPVTAVQRSL